jgi:predicted ABC-type ATPase
MANNEKCTNGKTSYTENKHSKVTMSLRNIKTDHMVEKITTKDQTPHTVATTTSTHAQEITLKRSLQLPDAQPAQPR